MRASSRAKRAREHAQRTFVVRTQSLFGLSGPSGKGLNFVELMLNLAEQRDELKVDQFRMAPTSTTSLAENMHTLLASDDYGLYHMSCHGETSWYEFARRIFDLAGANVRDAVANDFYPSTFCAPRATYLDNAALRAIDLDRMPALGGRARELPSDSMRAPRRCWRHVKILARRRRRLRRLIPRSGAPRARLRDGRHRLEVVRRQSPAGVSVVDKDILRCRVDDLAGYEQVIFLAGLSNDPMAEFDPAMNFVANAAVPSYLAYLAKRAGVRRMIYASSCSVYGYTVNELYDEDARRRLSHPVGISKLQGERELLQMGRRPHQSIVS